METCEVVIVGCGPTGALLSVLLGQFSISNIILEREPEVTTDPRGIALDEDGIRCLQACGIYDKIFTEIGQCMGAFCFIGGDHSDLHRKPFLRMNYRTTEGGTGHPGFIFHKQPSIESHLRSQIRNLPASDLRSESNLKGIREDEDWIFASYDDAANETHEVRAKFLVGCDGKTGFTRKRYLEPKGVRLELVGQKSYEETWIAMNWRMTLPTPETHPDFPLWQKGYTPQQVYDEFFPIEFRFLGNPKRPAVCGRFGLLEDLLWRFEFVVRPGESGDEMAEDDMIKKIVWPYLSHPGGRYGLEVKEVRWPDNCVEVLRCRPFSFSARSCNKWALGRAILCGDAAHVFPPFGGQGITSGFKDAIALAWRLATISRTPGADYQKLLQGWCSERKQSLDRSLASTIENGELVTNSNPLKIFLRDWILWFMQLIPSWRHWLELGIRRDGMISYKWETGKAMAFLPDLRGGKCFPQVYCINLTETEQNREVHFTDDVIFAPSKKGIFQLVVLPRSIAELNGLQQTVNNVDSTFGGSLLAVEVSFILPLKTASFILPLEEAPHNEGKGKNIFRLATAEEFQNNPRLCRGRPEPTNYDPLRIVKEVEGCRFVILRPDRFIFAAVDSEEELADAAARLKSFLASGAWV